MGEDRIRASLRPKHAGPWEVLKHVPSVCHPAPRGSEVDGREHRGCWGLWSARQPGRTEVKGSLVTSVCEHHCSSEERGG